MNSGQHAHEHQPGIIRRIIGFAIMLIVVVGGSYALRAYVIEPFQIPSSSMEDTIMTGDMVFTEKVSYKTSDPKQGDIVVFNDPQIPSRILIKRVIATEGQTVNLIDGDLYIDGVKASEPYTDGLPSKPLPTAGNVSITYPYTVPTGCVWVMGDNRTNSSDSRYFGPVDKKTVFGKAMLVYWPLDHIGLLK